MVGDCTATINVDATSSFVNNGFFGSPAVILNVYGSCTNAAWATFFISNGNAVTVNGGYFENDGELDLFMNTGTPVELSVINGGQFVNNGDIQSYGGTMLVDSSQFTVGSSGSMELCSGSSMILDSASWINNYGTMTIDGSSLTLAGGAGTYNYSTINVQDGGYFENDGWMQGDCTAVLNIDSSSSALNTGLFVSPVNGTNIYGSFVNTGDFYISNGNAVSVNGGYFENDGGLFLYMNTGTPVVLSVINGGEVVNNGYLGNFGGTVSVSSGGHFVNSSSGSIQEASGATITLSNSSYIENDGGLSSDGSDLISVDSGSTFVNNGSMTGGGDYHVAVDAYFENYGTNGYNPV
jgi:fibronectin-binding autotransporter adhesin